MSSLTTGAQSVNGSRRKKGCKCKEKAKSRNRENLHRWAELVEAVQQFEQLLYTAESDGVIDETSVGNIESAVRCLKGELFDGMPQEW